MTSEEMSKQAGKLAAEVISVSVGKLLLRHHYFSPALCRLRLKQGAEYLFTDGRDLSYQPFSVLEKYAKDENLPVHDLLHSLLHNIFRHWDIGPARPELWDAACDIAAEAVILSLDPELCPGDDREKRERIIRDLSLEVRPLTAEKLYHFMDKQGISEERLVEYTAMFSADDHKRWYKNSVEPEKEPESETPHIFPEFNEQGEKKENEGKEGEAAGGDGENQGEEQSDEQIQSKNSDSNSMEQWLDEIKSAEKEELSKQWEEISKQLQAELEGFAGSRDTERLVDVLKKVNRERTDYRAFLRRFAVAGEVMKPDLDSFDVGFYSYGMQLYGNVAFIEPPEHKEVRRIKDFVIAIDTSGSVSGKAVRNFVQKTYSVLKTEESFFSKVNIHILQCDTLIEDAAVITCEKDIERYIDGLEIKGLGGTDFRPVFEYVDRQRAEGKLTDLKGLIYFTDGAGIYPECAPEYETAFVFLEADYERSDRPELPPWAVKVVLSEGEIDDDD